MSGLLNFKNGRAFATGATPYFVGNIGEPTAGRLMIRLTIEGQPLVAAIDTGSPFVICHPDLAELLKPSLTDPLEKTRLHIRGIEYRGETYLMSAEIMADDGDDISLTVIVFIPQLDPGEVWTLPSFVGLEGMLQRMRFAVDPDASLFYFGPLGEA